MKIARFLMPMGMVVITAENEQAAKEFEDQFKFGHPIPWMQVNRSLPGTNPGALGTNPKKEQ